MGKYDNAFRHDSGDVFSPKGRLVWAYALLEPKRSKKFPEKDPQYSTGLLIPKAANIDAIKAEIDRVGKEVHGAKWKAKGLNLCLKQTAGIDKLAEHADEFPYVLSASANKDFPPHIIGPDAKKFEGDASDIYGGRWAVIAGSAWGSTTGKGNIGWNLNRIQLLDHDEPIAGARITNSDGFEAVSSPSTTGGSKEGAGTADELWN